MSGPRKAKSISDETKAQILESSWELIVRQGRVDVSMAEIAACAGVSRQTIFYAFGGRTGLLVAMVRHKDTMTDHTQRIRAALSVPEPTPEALVAAVEAWLDYLPVIYPVGILLDGAALTDEAASEAWRDRMHRALLGGFKRLTVRIHEAGRLGDHDPVRLAEEVWAQVHPSTWRRLVVECGWEPSEFRSRRLALIRVLVGVTGGPGAA